MCSDVIGIILVYGDYFHLVLTDHCDCDPSTGCFSKTLARNMFLRLFIDGSHGIRL